MRFSPQHSKVRASENCTRTANLAESALKLASQFRFIHQTDLYIQHERGGACGVAMAVRRILNLRIRHGFVIIGGGHFIDVSKCTSSRSDSPTQVAR